MDGEDDVDEGRVQRAAAHERAGQVGGAELRVAVGVGVVERDRRAAGAEGTGQDELVLGGEEEAVAGGAGGALGPVDDVAAAPDLAGEDDPAALQGIGLLGVGGQGGEDVVVEHGPTFPRRARPRAGKVSAWPT